MAGVFDIELKKTGETLYMVDERHYPDEEDDEDAPTYIEEEYILTWLHVSHFIIGDKDPYVKVFACLGGDDRYLICRFPSWEIMERGKGLKTGDDEKIMAQVTKRTVEILFETAVPHSSVFLHRCKIHNEQAKLDISLNLAKFAKESDPTNLTEFIDSLGYFILYVYFQRANSAGAVEIRKKIGYDAYIVTSARDVDPLKECSKLRKPEQDLLMDYISSISEKLEKFVDIVKQGNTQEDELDIWLNLLNETSVTETVKE